MKRFLRHPMVNAVCLGIFSLFYGAVFITTAASSGFSAKLSSGASHWAGWSHFLVVGGQQWIAYALLALTALVIYLLLSRKGPYDEYHASLLVSCLMVALVLTLVAIAILYLAVLYNPGGVVEKFTLFCAIHWVTVVLADLAFVLLCGRK